jgi:two-component system nitrate/nitrite response regulator NarL
VTRVLLIEDHRLVAQVLERGLSAEGFQVRSSDGTPGTLPTLLAEFPPDVVLLDLYLAEGRSGIDLLPVLRAPERRVVILTGESDPSVLARAFEAGADAVLNKAMPFLGLVRQIIAILQGHSVEAEDQRCRVLSQARAARAERRRRLAPFASLTPREEAVLAMLIEGIHAADIAGYSYVSLSTVRSQIRSVLAKLGVGSQLGAVSMAGKVGWGPGATASDTVTTGSSRRRQ